MSDDACKMLDRKDIAAMLNVSPETFRKSVERRPDFPAPSLRLSRKTVRWDEAEIRRWIGVQRARAQRTS